MRKTFIALAMLASVSPVLAANDKIAGPATSGALACTNPVMLDTGMALIEADKQQEASKLPGCIVLRGGTEVVKTRDFGLSTTLITWITPNGDPVPLFIRQGRLQSDRDRALRMPDNIKRWEKENQEAHERRMAETRAETEKFTREMHERENAPVQSEAGKVSEDFRREMDERIDVSRQPHPITPAIDTLKLSGEMRWIVVASRPTVDEAIEIALRFQHRHARVVRTQNSWFAVVFGPERLTDIRQAKQNLQNSGDLPLDFYISQGDRFAEMVWQSGNRTPVKLGVKRNKKDCDCL